VGLAFPGSTHAGSFNANFNDNQVPPGSAVYGNQGDDNAESSRMGFSFSPGRWRTTTPGSSSTNLDGGVPISGFTATFKLLIGNGSGAAGFSFNFAPACRIGR